MTTDNHQQPYDIIGHIHGHADVLERLLANLGYVCRDGIWSHAGGRKVLFLGDFIDRGPDIRRTLRIVKSMLLAGHALAVPGNHEFNALAYATPDGNGGWLRPHTPKNDSQHAETLAQFAGHEAEWQENLAWFRTLPLWLELPGLRAVHAAWDVKSIAALASRTQLNEALVLAASTCDTPEFRAVETLLKGVELPLPDGSTFFDNKRHARHKIRVRWWLAATGSTLRNIALQPGTDENEIPAIPADEFADAVPGYPADERPVFNGHYWLEGEPTPMAANVAILDYSVAKGGPLVAYRWDGEQTVDKSKIVTAKSGG